MPASLRRSLGGAAPARSRRGGLRAAIACVAIAAAAIASPAAQGPAPPSDRPTAGSAGTARLGGRVVRADTNAPLRRAQVTLSIDGTVTRQVTTDGDGRYEIRGLPPGRFTLAAGRAGYLTLQYRQRRPFEPGRPIELAPAQVIERIDFALPRASVIAGRVRDHTGEPAMGAEVRVERYQYGADGERRLVRDLSAGVLIANDLGEFRAFGLMPGEYIVSAQLRQLPLPPAQPSGSMGHAQGALPTYFPGTANDLEAQSIVVGLGEETFVQFGLVSGRMSRIAGQVVDSSGRPAAGGSLMLVTRAANSLGASGASAGTVAADGSFRIGNVAPGEHFLQVRLPARDGGTFPAEVTSVPLSVSGDDITGLTLTTSRGPTVPGRVEWDGRAPRTRGPAPLRIVASSADGHPQLLGSLGASTAGADGVVGRDDTFGLGGLSGRVRVTAEGIPPQWILKAVLVDGVDVTSTPLDTASLTDDSRVHVVLTDALTELSGRVRNARGEAVTEYVVVVLPDDPVDPAVAARYTRTARPDQRGAFRIGALPPGRYVAAAVDALQQGTEWDPAFQAAVRAAPRRFVLVDGQRLMLDLELLP